VGHTPASNPTYWLSLGAINATGAWATSTVYNQNDTATSGGTTYLAKWKHTSDASALATDLATADVTLTKYWGGASWLLPGVFIDGNLIVLGTIGARMFDGVGIHIGTGNTPNGFVLEVDSAGVFHVDGIFGGIGTFTNEHLLSSFPLEAIAAAGSTQPAFKGLVNASATDPNAHAVRGANAHTNASGLIGGQNGWDFYADGTGSHPGYGPFTGGHDALIANGTTMNFGDIVVDVTCIRRKDYSNTIFEVEYSTSANQKGAIGILVTDNGSLTERAPAAFFDSRDEEDMPIMSSEYDAAKDSYRIVAVNALGEGQINVCGEGGSIAVGDLIVCSSTPGKGMKQADDIVRSYTVAKAREAVTFSGPDDIKTVACSYHCG
jgi:hypothetical protein